MVPDFVFCQPVKILFGPGRLGSLAALLEELEIRRAVLVCDSFFGEKGRALMEEVPAICALYSDVEPNPQLSGAEACVRLARARDAQAFIALGGGSSIDTAKFAAAVAPGEDSAEACYDGRPFPNKPLKLIAIPTTAGTGSEVTQVSVMNKGALKRTINHPSFLPAAALVDPLLMCSVPPRATMITGLDALSHALEGYWSKNHQPLTDLHGVEAVRLAALYLERVYRDGSDMEARTGMAYASLLAGIAFGQPKTAGSHACSYPLSMDYHLPHGEACAFTLDSFIRINRDPRLEQLARAAGFRDCEALAERVQDLKA
ncbi:MAG: iron-containing alcohol dehydrogenase, partial [Clostridiales bacterium]|nr:iron-containing alcohol dehydrogenase [Clostridiales bacterium]